MKSLMVNASRLVAYVSIFLLVSSRLSLAFEIPCRLVEIFGVS